MKKKILKKSNVEIVNLNTKIAYNSLNSTELLILEDGKELTNLEKIELDALQEKIIF